MSEPGEISAALKSGYRVTVHGFFFPHTVINHDTGERKIVHAEVAHGARAVFCSQEWAEKLPKEGK